LTLKQEGNAVKPAAVVLFVSFAAALAACGDRQEEPETPASEPVVEAPQADTRTAPPVAEAPPAAESLPPPAALPETPSVAPPPAAPTPAPTTAAPTTAAPSPAPPAQSGATTPPAPNQDLAHGEQIYRKSCAFCHDRGTAGAPKVGDVQAWAPRIAQGVEVLYTNSIKGIRAMPPKGGNPTLSESDVKASVDYLVAKAR
jgi:cytochrome c5